MGETKSKSLQKKSFIMDINILESPFFLFNQKSKAIKVKDLLLDDSLSKSVIDILESMGNEESEVRFFNWKDSKGLQREMLALSPMKLPRKFTMDVWYALIGLYVKKSSPISYNKDSKTFDVKEDTLLFTFYELASFMKISTGGREIKKLKEAIRELKVTQYFSLANGIIYDKEKEQYFKSKERGISLIIDYEFQTKKKVKSNEGTDKNWVRFNDVIINNIKHEYIKYLNSETYFQLPSGLTRGLYSYIEANKYDRNGNVYKYIKRRYSVLGNKIPIDYRYNSDLKTKLKNPLKNLIDAGILKDFFYGDKEKINGIKEESIYLVFDGTKEDIIKMLTKKEDKFEQMTIDLDSAKNTKKVKEHSSENIEEFEIKIPEDILQALIELGVVKEIAQKWIKEYDKWHLIKYIIWIQKQQFEQKKINPAALLTFALRSNEGKGYDISKIYLQIVEFVDQQKILEESSFDNIEEKYEQYIENKVKEFKEKESVYEMFFTDIMIELQNIKDKEILESEEHKEFIIKKEKSAMFKKHLYKQIRLYSEITSNRILSFQEFEINFREGRIK